MVQTDETGETSGITTSHTFTTSTTNGTISTNIINYSGSNLPTTGDIGTTIFYVVGGVLVVGAVVVLITRRRMNKD
ncbi:MAG: LPXTG cell wall anchor domain-containing protein [Clostridiales bacterium]|nr:LPXTG cell wall anchor domain-containing protein [Clostridiales bacterium]